MRKTISLVLTFALCLALLAGCGRNDTPHASEATETPTATPAPTATPEPTEESEVTTEPEITGDGKLAPEDLDPAAVTAEANAMTDVLRELYENYHFGVAGSSLTGAQLAAKIVECTDEHGALYALAGALAFDFDEENEYGETFAEKLDMAYATAVTLWGANGKDYLASAGVEPKVWPMTMNTVRLAFTALYRGCGEDMPEMLRVYVSDDMAEHFLVQAAQVSDRGVQGFNEALREQVLTNDAAIRTLTVGDGVVSVDLNREFSALVNSMGTSGEYMLVGALVNTLLDNLCAESVILTVDGAPLETGHAVYDVPLTFFEDNAA